MNKVLVIPDCHVEPYQDLTRFEILGKFIVDNRPDVIVNLGDFGSMSALSRWNQDKRLKMENKRYEKDIQWMGMAIDLYMTPLQELQQQQRRNKVKMYSPRNIYIFGNHEDWVEQYITRYPELQGLLEIEKQLDLDGRGIEWYKYRERVEIDNVTYCHAPQHEGNMPYSGVHVPKKALARHAYSVVHGHTHRWENYHLRRVDRGPLSMAISCGCYFEDTPEYALGADPSWWSGLTLLHQYAPQQFDPEAWSMDRLKYYYN